MFAVLTIIMQLNQYICAGAKTDPYKWPFNVVAQTYSGWHTTDKVNKIVKPQTR